MKNEIRLIDKKTLADKGIVQLLKETPGNLIIEGTPITTELKELILLIIEAEKLKRKKEHARKTEEGMQRAGAKRGRTPIDTDVQEVIVKLREQGLTQERISQVLREVGKPVSLPTILKYCKGIRAKGSEENAESKEFEINKSNS